MKFVQLIEYNKINKLFFQKVCRNEAGRPDLTRPDQGVRTSFYFLKMLNMGSEQMICRLVSIYFDSPRLEIQ